MFSLASRYLHQKPAKNQKSHTSVLKMSTEMIIWVALSEKTARVLAYVAFEHDADEAVLAVVRRSAVEFAIAVVE